LERLTARPRTPAHPSLAPRAPSRPDDARGGPISTGAAPLPLGATRPARTRDPGRQGARDEASWALGRRRYHAHRPSRLRIPVPPPPRSRRRSARARVAPRGARHRGRAGRRGPRRGTLGGRRLFVAPRAADGAREARRGRSPHAPVRRAAAAERDPDARLGSRCAEPDPGPRLARALRRDPDPGDRRRSRDAELEPERTALRVVAHPHALLARRAGRLGAGPGP